MLDWWLLIIFGFFIGIIASMTGVGGGIFIVPILTFFYGFAVTQDATATSLTTIIFTAAASAINYARQKRIYFKTGTILIATTAPGALLGSWVSTNVIKSKELALVFGFFLIFVSVRMIISILRTKNQDKKTTAKTDSELIGSGIPFVTGVGLSFFGGFASGLLGIGGGTLVVPIMTTIMGMPIHFATATSMFTMIFTSIVGDITYYQNNNINFPFALLLAAGTIFGAQVGAHTSKKISGRNLSIIFSVVLMLAGINMIIKNWPL
jgi:hypothetical protein